MKHFVRYFTGALMLASYALPVAPTPNQPFSLTIKAPKESLKAGTDLRLLVTVTNTSNRNITFIVSPGSIPEDGLLYEIDARDSEGRPAAPSASVRDADKRIPMSDGSRTSHTLAPGESFVDQITVTRFYDLSQPGKYTISVTRSMPPRQNFGNGSVKSNTVAVTLVQ